MTARTFRLAALALGGGLTIALTFTSCRGAPEPTPPPTTPIATPSTTQAAPRPSTASAQATPAAPRRIVKLANGLTAAITRAPAGRDATLQFGILAGTAFVAAGSSELAAAVLLHHNVQGKPSLARAIAALGGTAHVRVGALTTWIDVRVPGAHWQSALLALRDALTAPAQSRSQIERVREAFVADRIAWIRRQPLLALAQVLMLGESSTAGYVTALLDRDPADVSLFQARLWQPDKAVLAIEVPVDLVAAQQALDVGGPIAFGAWTPPSPAPGPVTLLDRRFESGLYQVLGRDDVTKANCRVALVVALPELSHPLAAELLLMLGCLTLDGTGGRLERAQLDADLGHVSWSSEVVQTPDLTALVLTSDVAPADLPKLWRAVQAARTSLRDVEPSTSELEIAARRAPLTARLPVGDDGSRLRVATVLALRGIDLGAIDARVAALASEPSLAVRMGDLFQGLPFALVAVGGETLADVPGARACELLPAGLDEPGAAATASAGGAEPASGWLERAGDAIGDRATLRRLDGWRYEAQIVHGQAPGAVETCEWQNDGTLRRVRDVLGQKIETTLAGAVWSERIGTTTSSLDAREATFARREQQRHPLALLAAAARGELRFRPVARREAGDRTMMVLEAVGDRFDRLRVHVDTESHLVRVVESWETLPDGAVLRVHDAWSDYRTMEGLRVPCRRLTTHDDGANRVETQFTSWTPRLRLP